MQSLIGHTGGYMVPYSRPSLLTNRKSPRPTPGVLPIRPLPPTGPGSTGSCSHAGPQGAQPRPRSNLGTKRVPFFVALRGVQGSPQP